MSKELNTIELSAHKVEILKSITWGQKEDIQAEVMGSEMKLQAGGGAGISSSNIRNYRYRLLEIAIKSIKNEKGEEITFSKEWMRNLTVDDGDALYSAVEELISPKDQPQA